MYSSSQVVAWVCLTVPCSACKFYNAFVSSGCGLGVSDSTSCHGGPRLPHTWSPRMACKEGCSKSYLKVHISDRCNIWSDWWGDMTWLKITFLTIENYSPNIHIDPPIKSDRATAFAILCFPLMKQTHDHTWRSGMACEKDLFKKHDFYLYFWIKISGSIRAGRQGLELVEKGRGGVCYRGRSYNLIIVCYDDNYDDYWLYHFIILDY